MKEKREKSRTGEMRGEMAKKRKRGKVREFEKKEV